MKKFLIVLIFVIVTFLIIFVPNLSGSDIKKSKLYISEILSSNNYIILDDDGESSDYIEIYNRYKSKINLKDYYLSDSEYKTNKWVFPDIYIKPGEYLIVYASGKDKCDIKNRICHTNFKLSSAGEVVTLSDKNGNIISKVSYPNSINDVSYGYVDGKYTYNTPTPNSKNKSTNINIRSSSDIRINEYLVHNKGSNYTSGGYYYDWVELYNYSDEDINLGNLYISDNINKLSKYKLPNVVLKKDDYMVIYLSGKNGYVDGEVHTNFKLSDKDEVLILSDGADIVSQVKIVKLEQNISYGYKDENWYYFTTPTQGYENNTASFKSIGGK